MEFKAKDLYLLLAQEGLCFYCGEPLFLSDTNHFLNITRDHVTPKQLGGGDKNNIVLCHRTCNEQKAHRKPTPQERGLLVHMNKIVHDLKEKRRMSLFNYKAYGRSYFKNLHLN